MALHHTHNDGEADYHKGISVMKDAICRGLIKKCKWDESRFYGCGQREILGYSHACGYHD